MTLRTVTRLTGVLFFCIWLALLLVGANYPPSGLALIVALDAVAAVLVSLRMLTYLEWAAQRRAYRFARVCLDGLAVGLVFAAILFVLRFVQSGASQSFADALIWFAVVGCIGVANALAIYLCTVSLLRVAGLRKPVNYPQRDKRDA